ncbi:MAG: GSCFA domain-containing protein [Bacteroidales bacterium]
MDKHFRTIVKVDKAPFEITYNTPALFLGSCFTENIGSLMNERKFPVLTNPFGVVYNPISVDLVLKRIASGQPYTENELIKHNNLWLSLQHHTSFSSENKETCLNSINKSLLAAHRFWQQTKFLIITFGTARVYSYNETGEPVANCHKIPANRFTRSLLSVDNIVKRWGSLLSKIINEKPDLKIIFTVSPVRHWKDGATGNQLSKSTLLLGVDQLVKQFYEHASYFPSYEIMMDDLRDYRFYNSDMLHPSPLAVGYIWERFSNTILSSAAVSMSNEIEKIMQAVNHRPFNTNTKEYKQFSQNTVKRIVAICNQNPNLDFSKEIKSLEQHL